MRKILSFLLICLLCHSASPFAFASENDARLARTNAVLKALALGRSMQWQEINGPFHLTFHHTYYCPNAAIAGTICEKKLVTYVFDGTLHAARQEQGGSLLDAQGVLSISSDGAQEQLSLRYLSRSADGVTRTTIPEWQPLTAAPHPFIDELAAANQDPMFVWAVTQNPNTQAMQRITPAQYETVFQRVMDQYFSKQDFLADSGVMEGNTLQTDIYSPLLVAYSTWLKQYASPSIYMPGIDYKTLADSYPVYVTFDSLGEPVQFAMKPHPSDPDPVGVQYVIKDYLDQAVLHLNGASGDLHLHLNDAPKDGSQDPRVIYGNDPAIDVDLSWTPQSLDALFSYAPQVQDGDPGAAFQGTFHGTFALSDTQPAFYTVDRPETIMLDGPTLACPPRLVGLDGCGHWSQDYLATAMNVDILKGKPHDQALEPDVLISRGEMMTLVQRAYGLRTDLDAKLGKDIRGDEWFVPAIRAGIAYGIMQGYADDSIQPNRAVTRAEAAKIIVLAHGQRQENTAHVSFRDVSPTDWFYPYVVQLAGAGVLQGYSDATFRPYQPLTRAEAIKMIISDLLD